MFFASLSGGDFICNDCDIWYNKLGFYWYHVSLGVFLTNERNSANGSYVKVSIEEAERVKRLKAFL